MIKIVLSLVLIISLALPTGALELEAPEVPDSGKTLMPEGTASFGDSLVQLLRHALKQLHPDLAEATRVCFSVVCAVMLVSVIQSFQGRIKLITDIACSTAVASILLLSTNSMIVLATDTIRELSDYGKLLCPVMTTAMAAQGGVTTSTALYTGTAFFDAVLSGLISRILVPMVYFLLTLATANSAIGEDILGNMCDMIKKSTSWCLKTILTVFTTYMSITGVVSGTTDTAVLKATKVTISSVVPVVGGILSDSSEAVLVSAAMVKNAAGIYGILAILAVSIVPFLRIGCHYLLLKAAAAICSIFASKNIAGLIEDFSAAMGLLLAMTGSVCLLLLISTVCFMKGVG